MNKSMLLTLCPILLAACTAGVDNPRKLDIQPRIYPDYVGVTIPPDIAPMDFALISEEDYDQMDVTVRGSKGGEMHVQGDYADFDIDDWHELTQQNRGGTLTFTVCKRSDGDWTQYQDFTMTVSNSPLDDYGLTYRRIPPGYEVGGNIGIYQRDLHSFTEEPIVTETALPQRCFNCHTANRTNPNRITMQIRGEGGGTLICKDGKQQWIETKTDSTKAAGMYACWHPLGDYVAYTTATVNQSFFVGTYKPIEVYHQWANIVLLDTRTNELVLDERLMTPDWVELDPAFSADGSLLFYSTSAACNVPAEYEKVKCSIVSIPFDVKTGTFGEKTDTLLNGSKDNKSYVYARPSYDGKWMLYVRCGRGNFPINHPDADLWMMNLQTRKTWPLSAANSRHTDSYPNWSSNSRWLVFESKREDGQYTRLYLASIDSKGRATKAFLLPQRDPWNYYHKLFDAYNVPDFTKTRVDFDIRETRRQVFSETRPKVTIRGNKK